MSDYKTLDYKGKTIFTKIVMPDFKRIQKYFREEEACFMFIETKKTTTFGGGHVL